MAGADVSGKAAADTPMMRQHARMKEEAGDAILFFRMGDFYEMFHDDAVLAARELDLTLTARGKESGKPVAMAGVPYQAAESYVARLVEKGFRVALCDQVEDPATAKGLVRREIVRVVSPGTAMDDRALASPRSCFVTAAHVERGRMGCAHVDVSTGEFRFSEHELERDAQALGAELAAFRPRELLLSDDANLESLQPWIRAAGEPRLTHVDVDDFDRQRAVDLLVERFRVAGLGAWGLEGRPCATRAAGAALAYVERATRSRLPHLEPPRRVEASGVMGLDPTTQRNLEIVENLRDGGSAGTLLSVLDRTVTAMGKRALRTWLLRPLADAEPIEARLDAVEDLASVDSEELRAALERVADLERLLSKAVLRSATPRDLGAMRASLQALPVLKELLAGRRAALLREQGEAVTLLPELRDALERGVADEPPATQRDGGMIREGWSPELDELREIARDGRAAVARLEARERERSGIASLKVRHNKVFGYYLEVSRANLSRVPEDYERKQTLANAERFVTQELKDLEGTVLGARDRSLSLEHELFAALRDQVGAAAEPLRRSAQAIGVADAISSFAESARAHGYVRPEIDDSRDLVVDGGRHPVVERMQAALGGSARSDGRFVPNDVHLSGDGPQVVILTGPNMGGKSTYLRQVALLALMAQAGSFVPARKARVGLVDKLFTRVGASDSLATGESTFMVEMTETARILHEATPRSLVILDEIGRGTATFDGLSIAWAVAEHLHEAPDRRARTLFATHHHELTELATLYERVDNLRLATREWNDEIVFLHRVERGAGDRSYGIQVARLAGIPRVVVDRAREILANLEQNDLDPTGRPKLAGRRAGPQAEPPPQLPLVFAEPPDPRMRATCERLADIDVDDLTPRQALDVLAELTGVARRAIADE